MTSQTFTISQHLFCEIFYQRLCRFIKSFSPLNIKQKTMNLNITINHLDSFFDERTKNMELKRQRDIGKHTATEEFDLYYSHHATVKRLDNINEKTNE